jgi:hypothetical protein
MKFALSERGANSMVSGISQALQAAAMAPFQREMAEHKASLTNAQIYSNNMSGNKSGAQAESERFTLDQRRGVDDMMKDPALKPYVKNMLTAFKLTGDTNMDRFAKAGQTFQSMGYTDDAADNLTDPTKMNQLISIANGSTYMPHRDVGTTGYAIDQGTGKITAQNPVLTNLFGRKVNSEISENNASAYNSTQSGKHHIASAEKVRKETPGADGSVGKPLTNAQLRENETVQAARDYLQNVPREIIATVMNKAEFDLTPADKDLLARVKKARMSKYGEDSVPAELSDMLGLDRQVVEALANDLANPPREKKKPILPVIGRIFESESYDVPLTERQIIERTKQILPEADRNNMDAYVAAAKSRQNLPATSTVKNDSKVVNPSLQKAREAIASGAPREAVIQRLKDNGIDPTGL